MSNISLSNSEFELLRDFLEEKCGIFMTYEKSYLFEAKLSPLLSKYNLSSYWEFLGLVRNPENVDIVQQVINAITITETFWFRDEYPFSSLTDFVFPEMTKWRTPDDPINILSIGSSTGQEPYSIAMTIKQYCQKQMHIREELFNINACDINYDVINNAKEGNYSKQQIERGINDLLLQQYFERHDECWKLKDTIRNMVTFHQQNLIGELSLPMQYDVIFVRNVLIYFNETKQKECLTKIIHNLKSGGVLVLGAMESYPIDDFELKKISLDRGYYFKKTHKLKS